MWKAAVSLCAVFLLALAGGPVAAQGEDAGMVEQVPEIEGWDALVGALRDLPGQMLARLPEEQRKLFHKNGYGKPFPRDPGVVSGLERDGMLQSPAPAPWREAELEYLKNALGLKGHGLL